MMPDDPIHAALARWSAVSREFEDAYSRATQSDPGDFIAVEDHVEAVADARTAALVELYSTPPTSFEGLAALVAAFMAEDGPVLSDFGLVGTGIQTICDCIVTLADQGTAPGRRPAERMRLTSRAG